VTESPFPDIRWGSENSRLRKSMTAFGATQAGSWLIRTLTPLDRRLITRTSGRYTLLGPIGAPTLLLTTTGAKSGQPRTTPLLYARDGADLIVIGSNFGQSHHPAWTGNLLANPEATVTIGGTDVPARATLLDGTERDRAIQTLIAMSEVYAVYLTRTDRELRVFRLTAR
jgi:deazaflavin-dependent oxidoreductase (nitroreductase family)